MKKNTVRSLGRGIVISITGICLFCLAQGVGFAAQSDPPSLSRLCAFMRAENQSSPLYALGGYEKSYDPRIHAANVEYLKNHQDLLNKIRADLDLSASSALRWRLLALKHRLLYVPEQRTEFIKLYKTYCQAVIRDILSRVDLPNPYTQIVTLSGEPPASWPTRGLYAYIVHDLKTEYHARYEFLSGSNRKVAIELSGRYLNGEVGSYSSFMQIDTAGKVTFTHDTYTIWQDNAKNPYTALMTPVEETLHALLRRSTEAAIKAAVEKRGIRSAGEAKGIVDDWISVEEAVVGGLVYHMLPTLLENHFGRVPPELIARDLEIKSHIAKYHNLKAGIRVVGTLGYKACLALYLNNPSAFRNLL
jgi:hypothetical protein